MRLIVGVYMIFNCVTHKKYIGSAAVNMKKRIRTHRQKLNKGLHHSPHLQAAWIKYGSRAFRYFILERCSPKDCIKREQYWIDKFNSANPEYGYNVSPTAGSPRGVKHSPATRLLVSLAGKEKVISREQRDKISKSHLGMKHTLASRLKMSRSKTGTRMSEVTKLKMSLCRRGEQNVFAILNNSLVLLIRRRYDSGERCSEIAYDLGYEYATVYNVARRKTWKHI